MSRLAAFTLMATLAAAPAWSQTAIRVEAPAPDPAPAAPAPDKSGYTLFNPTPDALLRGFSPDRPAKGNSPITVDAGRVQYETDLLSYTHSNVGGVSTRLYAAFDPVLKVGLTNRIDLEVQFTGYNWQTVNQPGGDRISTARGAGDVLLRGKVNLFGNEGGPAMALIPYVKFPTAARNLGNGHMEGGVIAPITVPGPWGTTVLVEPEVDVLQNTGNPGHHFTYTQLLNLSGPITPNLTLSGELFTSLGTDAHSGAIYTFDLSLAYLLRPNLQLDTGVNIGLNRAAPNLQLYTGVAQRF